MHRSFFNPLGKQCYGPTVDMLRGSKLLATWHLLYLLCGQNTLADLVEVLAGDDECSVGGCSTDLLQVNRSSGRKNSTVPAEAAAPEAKEMEKPLNVSIGNVSNTSINASLKSANGWVGCWYYGCRRSYHPEFRCQCTPSCRRYGNCCGDFASRCWWMGNPSPPPNNERRRRRRRRAPPPPPPPQSPRRRRNQPQWNPSPPSNGRIVTVYHQTSPQACKAIVASSFRPGSDGHCGGAIYFAMSPEATKTKAIGTQSQSGCVIQAKVDVGRVKKEGPRCGHKWEQGELRQQGFDSIEFDPGDGQEVVIFNPNRVKSMKIIPYNNAWKPEYRVR